MDDSFLTDLLDTDQTTDMPQDTVVASDDKKYTPTFENPGSGMSDAQLDNLAEKTGDQALSDTSREAEVLDKNSGRGTSERKKELEDEYAKDMTTYTPTAETDISTADPFGNYNNLSWDDTLRLSRLADAYNSQRHWEKGKISLDGTGAENRYVQNTPIETEEMRRAGNVRNLNMQQAQYTLGRNNEALAYKLDLAKMFDGTANQAYAAYMDIQRNHANYVRESRYNEQFRAKYQQELQKDISYYMREMNRFQDNKTAAVIYNFMESDPMYGQWLAANMTQASLPSQIQYIAQQFAQEIVNTGKQQGYKYNELYQSLEQVLLGIAGYSGRINNSIGLQNAVNAVTGVATGAGKQ